MSAANPFSHIQYPPCGRGKPNGRLIVLLAMDGKPLSRKQQTRVAVKWRRETRAYPPSAINPNRP